MKEKICIAISCLTILAVMVSWFFREKESMPFYRPYSKELSNDSLFFLGTSDLLHIGNKRYVMSKSPVFGLPNALKIFSFGDSKPYMGIFYLSPRHNDKDYSVTWVLCNNRLTLTNISFLYPNEVVDKYYPNDSYFTAFAKGANLASELERVATWYSDSVYIQDMDTFNMGWRSNDTARFIKSPFLKLRFKNGCLESSQELISVRENIEPPNPFAADSLVGK